MLKKHVRSADETVALVSLGIPRDWPDLTGVDLRQSVLAESAINLLHEQMVNNRFGLLPANARVLLIRGVWHEGGSVDENGDESGVRLRLGTLYSNPIMFATNLFLIPVEFNQSSRCKIEMHTKCADLNRRGRELRLAKDHIANRRKFGSGSAGLG